MDNRWPIIPFNFADDISQINGWVSPRLGIRLELSSDTFQLYRPDGQPFADYIQVQQLRNSLRAKIRAS